MRLNNFILTQGGASASVAAEEAGIKLIFREVAVGTSGYSPQGTETALQSEVIRAPIEGGRISTDDSTLEWHALLLYPFNSAAGSVGIKEVGVFVDNPDPDGQPILALIWSHTDNSIAHLAQGEELYLSAAIKLSNINTANIEVSSPTPEARYLLKSEFDKYLQKSSVADEFTVDPTLEQHAMPSYLMVKRIKEDLGALQAAREVLNIGNFPKHFAPADTRQEQGLSYSIPSYTNCIKEVSQSGGQGNDNIGRYQFRGFQVYLFGQDYTLPSFTTDKQVMTLSKDADNEFTQDSNDETIAELSGANEGDTVYFVLSIPFNRDIRGNFSFSSIEIQVTDNHTDTRIDSLDASPLGQGGRFSIELARFTRGDNWAINDDALEHVNLIEKYATLVVDVARASYYKFNPTSPYILSLLNNETNSKVTIHTKGHLSGTVYTANNWIGMPKATRALITSVTRDKIAFEVYTDEDKELHVNSLFSDDLTGNCPIGTILPWHKNMTADALSLPIGWVECDGRTAYLLDGTEIRVPDLNTPRATYNSKGSFLRGHTSSGEWERDEFQEHTHRDSGHNHRVRTTTNNTHEGYSYDSGQHLRNEQSYNTESARANLGGATTYRNGTPRAASETRPVNMSVVWIMRIF